MMQNVISLGTILGINGRSVKYDAKSLKSAVL